MLVTASLIARAYRISAATAELWTPYLQDAAVYAELTTPNRVVFFLAQIGHESGRLRYTSEIWGPTPQQSRYERNFSAPWSPKSSINRLAYNLGNNHTGDGSKYRGNGLIQTTGRANTRAVTARLKVALGSSVPDFEQNPSQLRLRPWASLSAADFWKWRKLNDLADKNDFTTATRVINGGLNGLADRQMLRTQLLTLI